MNNYKDYYLSNAYVDHMYNGLIGKLMHHLCKERAFGRLQNRSEAIELARYWWLHNQPFCD